MGEKWENQRGNGEIEVRYSRPLPESWRKLAEAEEIVLEYRPPEPETVLAYSRPLPEGLRGKKNRAGRSGKREQAGRLEMKEVTVRGRMEMECWNAPPWEPRRPEPDVRELLELDGDEDAFELEWKLNRKQPRKRRRGLWVFAACVAVLVGLTAAAGLWENIRSMDDSDFSYRGREYDWHWDSENLPKEITIPRWPTGQDAALSVKREHGTELGAQEVYKRVNPSVVTVLTEIDGTRMSVGTGVVFTQDGYIVTNHHVVEGGRDCTVVLHTGYRCGARYVASDADQDLAILKIVEEDLPEGLVGLAAAEFGDSDLLTVGDPVYAIGNPLGYELRGTLTDGIVSAINRDVEVDGRNMTLIQTNAALNSGNSGGPLINAYGQVVGINVIKMSSDYSTVEGLGFAIPSSLMERMVNDLIATGELQPEPVLGVELLRLPTNLGGGVQGLEVQTVTPDSPADRAGVQAGDYVLKVDGEAVSSSQEVLRIRRRFHIGDQLILTLWREGEVMEVTLDLDQAVEN